MVVFLLIAGLVIDAGLGFRERRDAQNVSDLVSMAGTKVIADHYLDGGRTGADVYAAAAASAEANNCVVADDCTWEAEYVKPGPDPSNPTEIDLGPLESTGAIPAGAQGLRVTTSRSPDTFFMRIVGIDELDVAAPSTAMTAQNIEGAPGGVLLPIAAFDSDYEPGVVYELTAGKDGPGNFGWLAWNGENDPNTLASSICIPDNPPMTFPIWITGDPGKSNAIGVRDCVDYWIDNGTTVLIPIWGQTNGGGGNGFQYEIIGLGAFVLTSRGNPAIDTLEGRFVEFYSLPSVPGGYGAPPCLATDPDCNASTNWIGLSR